MSLITVKNLSKVFGQHTAVNNINFSIEPGQIVGFLGVNGAGKTTTMRMLNSYLVPSSGQILINGFCTQKQSIQARKLIGYMPENTPLPAEFKVTEYLKFRSDLKKIPHKQIKFEIGSVLEQCLLADVSHRVIGTLSKGYQQRVALADALLNHPPILILDEPTVGLDPNQIKKIREVIQNVGANKTVLLSTHIMQEVESICNKVIIIHKGQILVDDTPSQLKQKIGRSAPIVIQAKCDAHKLNAILQDLVEVQSVYAYEKDSIQHFTIETNRHGTEMLEKLFKIFVENDGIILEMTRGQNSLEEIFTKITSNVDYHKSLLTESLN